MCGWKYSRGLFLIQLDLDRTKSCVQHYRIRRDLGTGIAWIADLKPISLKIRRALPPSYLGLRMGRWVFFTLLEHAFELVHLDVTFVGCTGSRSMYTAVTKGYIQCGWK